MRTVNVCAHTFIVSQLNSTSVVLDCGSNRGEFSTWLSRHTSAQVFGFEPDPRLFPNLPALPRVRFLPKAVAAVPGRMTLNLGQQTCSSMYYVEPSPQVSVEVEAVDLVGFCAGVNVTGLDLLKLDVEGAELDILLSLPESFLAAVKQITVEFHDFMNAEDLPKIHRAIARIRGCGFTCFKFRLRDHSDVLFVNQRLAPLSLATRWRLLLGDKYWAGFRRLWHRRLAT